jgi:hypothetical protein
MFCISALRFLNERKYFTCTLRIIVDCVMSELYIKWNEKSSNIRNKLQCNANGYDNTNPDKTIIKTVQVKKM